MSLIKKVLDLIESNQSKTFNCIPFAHIFPRFSSIIPGIKKATYYGITGTPGSAKTQFTDFSFLYHALYFAHANDVALDVVYFSFEVSKEAKIIKGISKRLFDHYGIRLSTNALQKIGSSPLSDDQLNKIRETTAYFENLEKSVTFYDEPMTPSQIYKIMMDKMLESGTFDQRTRVYTPHNPDKYLIFIFDHISLIQPDVGQSLHNALTMFSANNIYFRNKFSATIINVHQQGAEGGVEQFTSKGENIATKLEPKLAGLADNRTLARDYDIVLGLFSPFKHGIEFHRGYKMKRFDDRVRFLSVIKNREGIADINAALYFDGLTNYFEELPKPDEFSIERGGVKIENEQLYEKYAKGNVGILDSNKQRAFTF